jgi:hypothetical protein
MERKTTVQLDEDNPMFVKSSLTTTSTSSTQHEQLPKKRISAQVSSDDDDDDLMEDSLDILRRAASLSTPTSAMRGVK